MTSGTDNGRAEAVGASVKLPVSAQLTVAVAVAGGLATLALAIADLVSGRGPSASQFAIAGVFCALTLLSWLKPLVVYLGEHSSAVHLDEGLLAFLLLAVDPALAVVTFALATVIAQAVIRRTLIKSLFNIGQVLIAVGAAVAMFRVVGRPGAPFGWVEVGAAFLGAAAFYLVSNASVAAILASLGAGWREALVGVGLSAALNVACVCVSVNAAFVWIAYPAALPLALLPLFIFRYALGGFFGARHDRTRLEGLFDATLEANASMGGERDGVAAGLLASARRLLRCSDAELTDAPASSNELYAPVSLRSETLWLSVAGRSRTEPFDRADQSLLDALAAVGSGALSNADLYQQSRRQQQRLAAITSSLGEGVCALSRSGRITFVNKAAANMLGWPAHEAVEDDLLNDPDSGAEAPEFLLDLATRAITTGQTVTTYDTRFRRADGSYLDVACTVAPTIEGDEAVGAVLVFRDISEQKQLTAELTHHALHDALTGLPNRRLFLNELSEALERSRLSGERHAVLFADIDRFKIINDSLGHQAGDLLLVSIAERIRAALGPDHLLARFGGDEFTVLLQAVDSIDVATDAANRILDAMAEPVLLPDGHAVVASPSIGIAVAASGSSRDDVLHDADVAMYEAKVSGRSGAYCVFDVEAMGVRSAERIELEVGLRQALERDELEVYYQPLFSVLDRRIVAAEALVRWRHPERGLLLPEEFIGLAEETGLVLDLGKLVLEKACRTARRWREQLGVDFSVGVNLSARQFQNPGLLSEIEEVLIETGVDPSQLCFEITESLAMHHVDKTSEVLLRLKALGASVAIDDFGTGHSALGYLARFPIDVVKIDRSFIEDVEIDPVKSAIVSAVLTMATAIGSTTVVEGVETESQLDHLRGLGCCVAQGFFLARPMSGEQLEDLIRSTRSRTLFVERVVIAGDGDLGAGDRLTRELA